MIAESVCSEALGDFSCGAMSDRAGESLSWVAGQQADGASVLAPSPLSPPERNPRR